METFTPVKGIVLRLEDVRGYGPYTDTPTLDAAEENESPRWDYPWHVHTGCPCDPIKHPTWLHDPYLPRIKALGSHWHQYKFGFESVNQYLNWFYTKKAREVLTHHKYNLNLYMSERVFVSPTQALFLPGKNLPWPFGVAPTPLVFDSHPACAEKIADMQYATL